MTDHETTRKPRKIGRMGKHSANKTTFIGGGARDGNGARPAPRRPKRRGKLEGSPRLPVHKERTKHTLRRVFMVLGIILVLGLVGGVAWGYSFWRSVDYELVKPVMKEKAFRQVITPPKPKEPYNILLLGSDIRPGEKAARSDTIIVARVDEKRKKVWMISIPRDTKAEIPGYGTDKINAAHFYGGPTLTVKTVERFLDVEINHYMEVEFEGFEGVVDSLGGVWIDVDTDIDDWNAASHSKKHKAKKIDKGYQLLDGEHALTYVRSRDFPDADFTRMRHQQTFFKALAAQSMRVRNVARIPKMVRSFARFTTTDMSVSELVRAANALRGMPGENLQATTVKGEWITPYVIADEAQKKRIVTAFKKGRDIEPRAKDAKRSAKAPPGIDPSSVTVTVRNGAGIEGVAKEAADALKSGGFRVGEIGNAGQFVYEDTLVVYGDGCEEAAAAVAAALPHGRAVASRGMYSFESDVLVVVGKDWQLPAVRSAVDAHLRQ